MDLARPTAPIRLNLDTTRRCPLSCWYCHSSSGPDYRGPEIDPNQIPGIFDAAEENRIFEITITGGEPTMWPGLVPMLEQSPRLEFSSLLLITNALATPPRLLRAIESANLSRICVSLDGVGPVHDRNRGPGTYERTIQGIRELRKVHDNLAVISVIDRRNYTLWPDLTKVLAELGITAHHLTPVCTAGNALNDYHGLTADQFAHVHQKARKVAAEVPQMAILFNDELVHPLNSRTMGIHQFTENWKGWHRIVRPDGDVRTQIRAWGRTWRSDESLGNINQQSLSRILSAPVQVSAFTRTEEVARKFQIAADASTILADLAEIHAVENRQTVRPTGPVLDTVPVPDSLGIDVADLSEHVSRSPRDFRIREENGFAMLFDTQSHEIHVLTDTEYLSLAAEMVGVPT